MRSRKLGILSNCSMLFLVLMVVQKHLKLSCIMPEMPKSSDSQLTVIATINISDEATAKSNQNQASW